MRTQADISTLKREIVGIQKTQPALSADNAFILWFLHASLLDSEEAAAKAVVGGARDKGIDAIYVDHPNKKVFIIQGKYRTRKTPAREARPDVISFADLARTLRGGNAELRNLVTDADPIVRDRLTDAFNYIRRRGYGLHLHFVTTGKVSTALKKEAQGHVSAVSGESELSIYDRQQVLNLLSDYLEGAAPPVPSLDLSIEPREGLRGGGMIKGYDPATGIESWVLSMLGSDVGDLFKRAGSRLFARNIRGFLGSTDINRGMRYTLKKHPKNFWYFNNGVTIVCDATRKIEERGREILRVFNPQVINGQQTTRVLRDYGSKRASVLVRVIAIPRDQGLGANGFEELVGNIVAATNRQNAIAPSDLRSNDAEQVRIDREFRRLNYQYLRKRQSKAEARRLFGTRGRYQIKKEDLAKAVAACEFDPAIVRLGKERLFEDPYYPRIFCGRTAAEYLTYVWVDRIVRSGSKGKPERAYARWLVLNFVWRNVKDLISRNRDRDKFLNVCENRRRFRYLDRYVDIAFHASSAFFRSKRGTGAEAIDVSSFFRRMNLHEEFERYWKSAHNRYRRRGWEVFKRFRSELLEAGE